MATAMFENLKRGANLAIFVENIDQRNTGFQFELLPNPTSFHDMVFMLLSFEAVDATILGNVIKRCS